MYGFPIQVWAGRFPKTEGINAMCQNDTGCYMNLALYIQISV